jgi:hypothetical protein
MVLGRLNKKMVVSVSDRLQKKKKISINSKNFSAFSAQAGRTIY